MCLRAPEGLQKPCREGFPPWTRVENVALCLLDGLVLCLEQNFQKLGGVLVWEKLAGAEGEGSPAQHSPTLGGEWDGNRAPPPSRMPPLWPGPGIIRNKDDDLT